VASDVQVSAGMSDLVQVRIAEPPGAITQLWCSMPEGRGPFPTVIVLPTVAGVNGYIAGICARLNAQGFGAAALDYHGDRTMPDLSSPERVGVAVQGLSDVDIVASTTAAAITLADHPDVDGDRLGLLGFCAGASFALQVASSTDRFRGVVLFYGVLRYAQLTATKPVSPVDTVGQTITPIVGHFGEEDPYVSLEDVAELRRRTHGLPVEVYTYPGAGHGFHQHASPGYRPVAAVDAWRRSMDFLDWHLGGLAG